MGLDKGTGSQKDEEEEARRRSAFTPQSEPEPEEESAPFQRSIADDPKTAEISGGMGSDTSAGSDTTLAPYGGSSGQESRGGAADARFEGENDFRVPEDYKSPSQQEVELEDDWYTAFLAANTEDQQPFMRSLTGEVKPSEKTGGLDMSPSEAAATFEPEPFQRSIVDDPKESERTGALPSSPQAPQRSITSQPKPSEKTGGLDPAPSPAPRAPRGGAADAQTAGEQDYRIVERYVEPQPTQPSEEEVELAERQELDRRKMTVMERLERAEYFDTGATKDSYVQRLEQSGLGGPPPKTVVWGRHIQKGALDARELGRQTAAERQERAAKEMEQVGAYFSNAPMGILQAEFNGDFVRPTPPQVAYSDNFNPEDPAQVEYVQGWLREEGEDIAQDGVWGEETVTSLMKVVRTRYEEAVQIEVDWIQENLVAGGYLDDIGDYTVEDLAAAAGDPNGPTEAKMRYRRALMEWAEDQARVPTVGEARETYFESQGPLFGLPTFAPVEDLKYLVNLPSPLAHGVDVDMDVTIATYESQQRQRALLREGAKAHESSPWWDGTKSVLWTALESIIWPSVQTGGALWAWGQSEGGESWTPLGEYGPAIPPVWSLPAAVNQWRTDPELRKEYETYQRDNPWDAFVVESVFDPLNFVGLMTVGKAAKVVRAGSKWQTIGGLVGDSRIFGMADQALGYTAKVEHARPIRWGIRKSMSPVGKATKLASRMDNIAGRQALRAVNMSELASRPLSAAIDASRESLKRLRHTDFGVDPEFGARAAGDVTEEAAETAKKAEPAFWDDLSDETRAYNQTRVREATQSVAAALSDGSPELQRLVDSLGSRLYDDAGNLTPVGARLQAILSKESYISAREAAIDAGEMIADDLGDAHYAGPGVRADLVENFHGKYLVPAQNEMGAVLESLDAYARRQGYEAVVDGPMIDEGGRLLDQAMQKRVIVDNPNRPGAYVWADAAQKGRDRLLGTIDDLSARADRLASEGRLKDAEKLSNGVERNFELVVARTPREQVRLLDEKAALVAQQSRRLDRFFQFLHRRSSREVFESFMKKVGSGDPVDENWLKKIMDAQDESDAFFNAMAREYKKTRLTNLHAQQAALERKMAAVSRSTKSGAKASVVRALRSEIERVERLIKKIESGEQPGEADLRELLDRYGELRGELDDIALRKADTWNQAEKVGAVDLPLSPRQVDYAVDTEYTQWERFYTDRRTGEIARGKEVVPDDKFNEFLVNLKKGIRDSYRGTSDGWYVDTRDTIEVSRMHLHEDAWVENPLRHRANAQELLDETGKHVSTDVQQDLAQRELRLAGLADRGAFAGEETAAMRAGVMLPPAAKQEARELFRGFRSVADRALKDVGERVGTLPTRASGGVTMRMGSLRKVPAVGELAEQAMKDGRKGRDYALEGLVRRMDERRVVLDEVEDLAKNRVMRKEGMYWRALEHSQHTTTRALFKTWNTAMAVWRFGVLAGRLGWTTRNVMDNTVKTLEAGVFDPRFYVGKDGLTWMSRTSMKPLEAATRTIDRMAGTNVTDAFQTYVGHHMAGMSDETFARLMGLENIPIPSRVAEGSFAESMRPVYQGRGKKALDRWWNIVGTQPENFFRKAVYRHEYHSVLQAGGTVADAERAGMDKVAMHLFQYDDPMVFEDTLRNLWPFVMFWARNAEYWPTAAMRHPQMLSHGVRFEQTLMNANDDRPMWMRRYLDTSPVGDFVAGVPGLSWMAGAFQDSGLDPLNALSFAPLYRFFKARNPMLPDSEAGIAFVGEFLDAFDKYGLGMNPFLKKPMEAAGLIDPEMWRHVMPQTDLIKVFTANYWPDTFPSGLDIEAMIADPLLEFMGQESLSDFNQRSMDEAIQFELARQQARGEPLDVARAEAKVRKYLAVTTITGYFTGAYARQMSSQDIALAGALDEGIRDGGDRFFELMEEQPGFKSYLRARRQASDPKGPEGPADVPFFREWAEISPALDAYSRVPLENREEFLAENPELVPYVRKAMDVSDPVSEQIRRMQMLQDTSRFYEVVENLGKLSSTLTDAERQSIIDYVKTPELEQWWHEDDSTWEKAERDAQGRVQKLVDDMTETFMAIPETDTEARESFLKDNPLMLWAWSQAEKNAGDQARLFMTSANAAFRKMYFGVVEKDGMAAAEPILERYPWMFEFSTAQDRVTEDGRWVWEKFQDDVIPSGAYQQWSLENPFEAAKARFWSTYYGLPPAEREDYLREFGARYGFEPRTQAWGAQLSEDILRRMVYTPSRHNFDFDEIGALLNRYGKLSAEGKQQFLKDHPILQKFFDTYSSRTAKGEAFLAIKDQMREYWNLPDDKRGAYLDAHPDLEAYFAEYGDVSERAKAYRAVKDLLEEYADLPDEEKEEWLLAHPEVEDYFAKWAGPSEEAKAYLAVEDLLEEYGQLKDSEKGAYVDAHPRLQEYFNEYGDTSKKALAFQKVEHLMEEYSQLASEDKDEYLANHPELQKYFDRYADKDSGSLAFQRVQADFERYVELSPDERGDYLDRHPELQAFFDDYGSPSERAQDYLAVKDLLDEYSTLADSEKSAYVDKHPKLQAYFDNYAEVSQHALDYQAIQPLLEEYFDLPIEEKAAFREKHPEIQEYFDKYGGADRASVDERLEVPLRWRMESAGYGDDETITAAVPKLEAYLAARGLTLDVDMRLFSALSGYATTEPNSPERREYIKNHPELGEVLSVNADTESGRFSDLVDAFFGASDAQLRGEFQASTPEFFEYPRQTRQESTSRLTRGVNPRGKSITELFEKYWAQYGYEARLIRHALLGNMGDPTLSAIRSSRGGEDGQDRAILL